MWVHIYRYHEVTITAITIRRRWEGKIFQVYISREMSVRIYFLLAVKDVLYVVTKYVCNYSHTEDVFEWT